MSNHDLGAIFPTECRVCHQLVRPGRPGWARVMIVCRDCSARRDQLAPDLDDAAPEEQP